MSKNEKLKTFKLARRKNWNYKISSYDGGAIMIVAFHKVTTETIVKFLETDAEVITFINFLETKDELL
jgi:hypothetical protein